MEKLKIVNNMNNANAITHNGKFHVDEVFSTVLLMKVFDNIKVVFLIPQLNHQTLYLY